MIIYGSRATALGKELATVPCPHCGTQHSTEIHVFQRHAHVFWIPFIPIGKIAASECHHCKNVSREKEMSAGLKKDALLIKQRAKTPVWTFIGAALLVFAIAWGAFESKKDDAQYAAMALAPHTGDMLRIKTKSSQYTLFKIEDVQGDSVYLRLNRYETNKVSGLYSIQNKGEEAWSEDLIIVEKKQIKTMFDKGTIISIARSK